METRQGQYRISTDKACLDVDLIHEYLSQESYWARGRPRCITEAGIEESLCFGVYEGPQQVGFARVVTDYATFAWLCDVFIIESKRGQGLGKWLVASIVGHPRLQSLKLFVLATSDAHELYRHYGGFEALEESAKWMVRGRDRSCCT